MSLSKLFPTANFPLLREMSLVLRISHKTAALVPAAAELASTTVAFAKAVSKQVLVTTETLFKKEKAAGYAEFRE
ncbi:hypothetical protein N7471_011310 [Penicillium samsonianum]|uniref:uncharacterized protein n=1 Tax=Penicillium samsonianum TaxID=1882272 RepID=UPI00254946A3|nr:uncharacterized protein N7471_011310 [Penicillium samsonianum]KAJ6123993.1 hypothetical protein N7471_011310 [Penicillium samsonianum]